MNMKGISFSIFLILMPSIIDATTARGACEEGAEQIWFQDSNGQGSDAEKESAIAQCVSHEEEQAVRLESICKETGANTAVHVKKHRDCKRGCIFDRSNELYHCQSRQIVYCCRK